MHSAPITVSGVTLGWRQISRAIANGTTAASITAIAFVTQSTVSPPPPVADTSADTTPRVASANAMRIVTGRAFDVRSASSTVALISSIVATRPQVPASEAAIEAIVSMISSSSSA